eukprot:377437-Prymnesium_polylepis.1
MRQATLKSARRDAGPHVTRTRCVPPQRDICASERSVFESVYIVGRCSYTSPNQSRLSRDLTSRTTERATCRRGRPVVTLHKTQSQSVGAHKSHGLAQLCRLRAHRREGGGAQGDRRVHAGAQANCAVEAAQGGRDGGRLRQHRLAEGAVCRVHAVVGVPAVDGGAA